MQLAGSAGARMMLWTALLGYVGWLVLFSIYRYAVALEILVPLLLCVMLTALMGTRIGVAATVGGCFSWWPRPRRRISRARTGAMSRSSGRRSRLHTGVCAMR
jgi:hypothetical protein